MTLDAARHDIPTRFLAQGIEVPPGETVMLDLTAGEWQSALARVVPSPFAPQMERGGVCYLLVHQETWKNPFPFDFPRSGRHVSPAAERALPNASCFCHPMTRPAPCRFNSPKPGC